MHMLAKHFTDLIKQYLDDTRKWFTFGDVFTYNDIRLGEMNREVMIVILKHLATETY